MDRVPADLRRLARLYGIQTAFTDTDRRLQPATQEALLETLRILGADVSTPDDLEGLVADRMLDLWEEVLPPAVVAWQGAPAAVEVRLPVELADHPIPYRLKLESGETQKGVFNASEASASQLALIQGETFLKNQFTLSKELATGYHRLEIELDGHPWETMILSAPPKTFEWRQDDEKAWGVFLPLYALHRSGSWGAGDLSDLEALIDWTAKQGGRMVATLPMSATFAERTDDPSPYSPASRLFFNEFYLTLSKLPELSSCQEARRLLDGAEAHQTAAALRADRLLNHQRWMAAKRAVLEPLAQRFFESGGDQQPEYLRFIERNPLTPEYAAFRATGEKLGLDWRQWPENLREGTISAEEGEASARRYHLYVQFRLDEQLTALADKAHANSMIWYADLPLGVSSDSFDVWKNQSLFALGASGGAPPDAFFTAGQNWGFPPIHPHRLREQGYQYFIETLRRQFQTTKLLRLDHIMGLYRLFWIPSGLSGKDGAYVRYPQEELFAVLSIESHRRKAGVVGEDLGTVPKPVRAMMDRHGVSGMYVLPFEASIGKQPPLNAPKSTAIAGLNTHDLPTFTAFWEGLDVAERLALGLLNEVEAKRERAGREGLRKAVVEFLSKKKFLTPRSTSTADVLKGALAFLAQSDASVLLVNLEDLWQETEPQNTPGTWKERPNWRRRARHSFDDFSAMKPVIEVLRLVDAARRSKAKN